MTKRFDKDAWILDALAKRYLIPQKDGSIFRRTYASADGSRLSAEVRLVKYRVHKKSGRVYFNMTWRGVTKSVLVNRVIALAFLPNPENLPQVNHIDGDKENNALSNLEWSSGRDNEKHAHANGLKSGRGSQNSNAKLTAQQVVEMRQSGKGPAELSKEYGVARSTVVNVLNRKTWSHV